MPDSARNALDEALARARAEGWESGFHAGQTFGAAMQKHDPQWDYYEPAKPENPYLPLTPNV